MISLVVPTYNERSNIETLVECTGAALASTGEIFELIIVDDSSPDGTADAVRRLQPTRPWLTILERKDARDLSTAVIAGWSAARGDVLGCMDADLQHPPEVLPRLLARLRTSGADVVVASRNVRGGSVRDWSLTRRFVSWTSALLATLALPGTLGKVHDPMSGFFLIRRLVVDRVVLNPVGYKILLEVLARGNYNRVEEVPFVFEERTRGGSKIGFSTALKYLRHLTRISFETGEATRMIKFALVGLSGVVVNILCYRLLIARPGWTVWSAATGAAGLAVVSNFIWNERLTFWETHTATPDGGHVLRRFLVFTGCSAGGFLLNVGVVSLLEKAGIPWATALAVGISLAGLWNFFSNSNLTWHAWWDRKTISKTVDPELARNTSEGLRVPAKETD